MNLCVGTSGFTYPKWRGSFYPSKLPTAQMLNFYASRFRAVEINNTFRSPPTASALEAWANQTPPNFCFALKAPMAITHIRRLIGVDEMVSSLFETTRALKKRLGPILFQLPPNFKKDMPRLRAFLALLPPRRRAAIEFRHPSWFDDETFGVLRKHRVAHCVADAGNDLEVPFVATANWGYLRLRRDNYSNATLKSWATRIRTQSWRDCFVFFKHEDMGVGPQLATRLTKMLAAR